MRMSATSRAAQGASDVEGATKETDKTNRTHTSDNDEDQDGTMGSGSERGPWCKGKGRTKSAQENTEELKMTLK